MGYKGYTYILWWYTHMILYISTTEFGWNMLNKQFLWIKLIKPRRTAWSATVWWLETPKPLVFPRKVDKDCMHYFLVACCLSSPSLLVQALHTRLTYLCFFCFFLETTSYHPLTSRYSKLNSYQTPTNIRLFIIKL